MDTDRQRGLYQKYRVERLNDPAGKHAECPFFVLDLRHDYHARIALIAYIESCHNEFPQLAEDLDRLLRTTPLAVAVCYENRNLSAD